MSAIDPRLAALIDACGPVGAECPVGHLLDCLRDEIKGAIAASNRAHWHGTCEDCERAFTNNAGVSWHCIVGNGERGNQTEADWFCGNWEESTR